MQRLPGFLPLYWNAKTGKLYLEIPHLNTDMVYFDSLPYGTGSNDLGLDRGQISRAKLVRFERFGPRILLVQPSEVFSQLKIRRSGWRCGNRFRTRCWPAFAVEAENAAPRPTPVRVGWTATGVPQEYRGRSRPDVCFRRAGAWFIRRRSRARPACVDGARAPFLPGIAGARICTAPLRSARWVFSVCVPRLRGCAGSAAGANVHPAAPLDQAGSDLRFRVRSG